MTGSIPFSNVNREPSIILHVIKGNLPIVRDDAQLSHIRTLCSIMTDCWNADLTARPNASECKAVVQWMPLTVPSTADIASGPKIRSGALLYKWARCTACRTNWNKQRHSSTKPSLGGRSTGQDLAVAFASLGLGQVHAARLENSKAIECFSQSMDIFVRNDEEHGQAAALIALGQVYDDQSEANALIGLGNAAGAQSRLDEAVTLYIQARDIYIQIGHQLGRANALTGLGDIFRKKSELSEAKTYYEDAHDYYGRVGNELGIARTLHGLGDVYNAGAEYKKASAAYEEAQQIFSSIDRPLGKANALVSLMPLRIREGRFPEAVSLMEEAISIYESIGRTEAGKKAREVLSTLRQLLSEVESGYQQ
ncbi:hypothetical protein M407DRAFT_26590 [Tulasnella calospora MUT 4182]|uniref:Uncharacterized protein n=1 Tax=Tulasnella calospora MUT 4182 TaxID=1051891 RepID=A0A0C3QE09_9AGAM|nr:hypothetical protein M407DRAFT_26590 [Tulasnella calospora MUT 4182]